MYNFAPLRTENSTMTGPPTKPEFLLIVGTGNRHKVEEIAAALAGFPLEEERPLRVEGVAMLPAAMFPAGPDLEESGRTFLENARIKARTYALRAAMLPPGQRPRWVLADDSGLSVDALGGEPGVRSARYAGPGATDRANNQKLLAALAGVPRERRGAEFVCALSLVEVPASPRGPAEEVLTAEGRCRGEILLEERGSGGFGYDPLFLVPALERTFAQITREEKTELSHRGRALKALRTQLGSLQSGSLKA